MKYGYNTIVLITISVFSVSALPCRAQEDANDIWTEDVTTIQTNDFDTEDPAIEHLLDRLAEQDPNKAGKLKELRKEDPGKFREELRRSIHELSGKRPRERGQRNGRWEEPGMGPGGRLDLPRDPGEFDRHARIGYGQGLLENQPEKYIEWLQANYPEEAEKLAKLKTEEPRVREGRIGNAYQTDHYTRQLALGIAKYGRIFHEAQRNPELAEVMKESMELAHQQDELLKKIRTADEGQKTELTEQLKVVVGKQFDLILKRKQLEYERLQQKLKELEKEVQANQAQIDQWKEQKDKMVTEHIEELVGKIKEFRWE